MFIIFPAIKGALGLRQLFVVSFSATADWFTYVAVVPWRGSRSAGVVRLFDPIGMPRSLRLIALYHGDLSVSTLMIFVFALRSLVYLGRCLHHPRDTSS